MTSNAFLGGQTPSESSDKRSWHIGYLVYSTLLLFRREKDLALLAAGPTGCGEWRGVGVPLLGTFSVTRSTVFREADRRY